MKKADPEGFRHILGAFRRGLGLNAFNGIESTGKLCKIDFAQQELQKLLGLANIGATLRDFKFGIKVNYRRILGCNEQH